MDNGIKGAEGGTALRNVILSLSAPTDKARSLMKDLGLEVLDAQGNMRPLNEIFGDLNDKLSTMTQGERTEVLSNLFNKVDLKSVNALLSNSGERFDELSGYIDNADGAAAAMAETMNDNLKGKLTELGSSLEGVGIQIYEKLEGPLKTAAETAIESIGKLGESLTSGNLSKSLESIGESIGRLIEKGADLIADILPILIEGFAWFLDNGATIVSVIAGITGAIVAFKAVGIIQGVVGAWEEAVKQIALFQLGAEGATLAQGVLTGALTLGETIVALLTGKITLATVAQKLWNLAMSANPIGVIVGLVAGLVAGLVVLWNTNEGFRNAVLSAWEAIKQGAEDCWGAICNFFTETLPQAWQATVEFFQGIPDWFANLWNQVTEKFNEWGTNITNFFNETIPMWIENISAWFSELPYKMGEALGSALANIVNWGVDTWNYFSTNVPIWIENVSKWFSELPGKIWTWLSNAIDKIVKWGTDTYNKAKQYVDQTISAVSQYFSELPGKVWKWLSDTVQKMIQWGTDMLNKGKKAAEDTAKSISDGFKNLPDKMLNIGKSVVEGIWNGITGMGSWIKDKIGGFCSGIVDGFKSSLKINSPSKIMRDKIGKGIVEGIDVGIENEMPVLDKDISLNMNKMVSKMKATVDMETSKVSIPVSSNFGTTENQSVDSTLLEKILSAVESIDPNIYMDSRELVDSTVDLFDKSNGQRIKMFERGVNV